jgi:hypothetical protein
MAKRWSVAAAFLLAVPAALMAQESSGAGEDEKAELTDKLIEERKAGLDKTLEKAVAEVEKRFAEHQAFETSMKDARVAFERKSVEERKTFLDSLKSKKPEERKAAMRDFRRQMQEKRRAFVQEQRGKSEEFRRTHKEERREFREGIRKEHRGRRRRRRDAKASGG